MSNYERLWVTFRDSERLWESMHERLHVTTRDFYIIIETMRDDEWVPGIVRLQELDYIRDNTLV